MNETGSPDGHAGSGQAGSGEAAGGDVPGQADARMYAQADTREAAQALLERGMRGPGHPHGRPGSWWVTPLIIVAACVAAAVWTVHGFVARHEAAVKARRDAVQDGLLQGRVFDDVPASPASSPVAGARAPALAALPPAHAGPPVVRSYYDAPLLSTGDAGATAAMVTGGTVADGGSARSGAPAASAGETPVTAQGMDSLEQLPVSTGAPRVRAGFTGNRSLLLAQGTKIECAGDTAFDSTLAGIATCTVTRNVYSDDGRVVLVERGSQIITEYRSNLSTGQSRVFILAARIRTPEGVSVEISSPAADALGRMGTGGHVDNHWGERIGAALLLGMTQDAIGYLATRGGNSTSTTVFENTQGEGNSMAARVLDHTVGIAPTLTQNQGAQFTIVLARDLDFSAVYRLEPEDLR
ncbi:type IV secretion system protein VirB10 [Paraburkholderia phosphatilytica]|uniref:type IV secretion system protein VirB10 n=1 Tax=Paraburkholderia phosphatilytica TaxID=2282883 RepID=UPI001F0C8800|nr:type IV secretion system protein VirB10 [Paraburkholderia phosphatilytica]